MLSSTIKAQGKPNALPHPQPGQSMTYDQHYHFTNDPELLSDVCQFVSSTWNQTVSYIPSMDDEQFHDFLASYKCYDC